ncbi:hypothetical protein AZE42_06519 [Rhizopogon vesiculosus]|uniref:Uncharacterized protein n=1 Tax=Rhizopogon vesiculosus TaxID=180088 RepID=A0A1J8QIP6_9AGAM|nr:hypothetical protein AZE42_06519 [Rhizopogon vesiculosus]
MSAFHSPSSRLDHNLTVFSELGELNTSTLNLTFQDFTSTAPYFW